MITLPSDMILASVIFAVAFGIGCGFLYTFIHLLFKMLCRLVKRTFKDKVYINIQRSFLLNAFDFLFVFFFGTVYLTFAYVLVDGVLELYSIIMLFMGFLVSKRLFDRIFGLK